MRFQCFKLNTLEKSQMGVLYDIAFHWKVCAPMSQCNSLSKYLLPKGTNSEKKCLCISWSVRLSGRPNTMPISANEYYFQAVHCRYWITLTGGLLVALSEGFLLLSVESLCTLSSCDFWLVGEQQQNPTTYPKHKRMGQGISLCAESMFSDARKDCWGGEEMLFFITVGKT